MSNTSQVGEKTTRVALVKNTNPIHNAHMDLEASLLPREMKMVHLADSNI